MAAAARGLAQRLGRAFAFVLAGIVLATTLFALAGWIGSSIPRNPDWTEAEEGVEIMVETNGIHTSLILPMVTPEKDWRTVFPASDVAPSGEPYTHISVSWGEREVFLNTPTWWDLSPGAVLRIIGFGGPGLLHVAHYVRPAPSEHARPLMLSHEEYRRLVAAIGLSLPEGQMARHHGYGQRDVFYDARGEYTVSNTCNQWTGNVLAAAGVRIGRWTPFAGGVMKWIPNPEA